MNTATRTEASTPGVALSETEMAAVRAELGQIVHHPLFGHSKRYPALLSYVVERTLDGHGDELKERVVGIEALGRPASYDTSQDPVVRTTAAEVRRRLAQYYQQANGSAHVRIDLPVGSYVPQFAFPNGHGPVAAVPPVEVPAVVAAAPPVTPRSVFWRWVLHPLPIALAAVALVAVTGLWAFWRPQPTALDTFWKPLLSAKGTVLVGVGRATGIGATGTDGAGLVTLNAATAASQVVGVLQAQNKDFEIRAVDAIEFADVRSQPVIAIGGFNNQWTMKITNGLRFGYEPAERASMSRIVDRDRSSAPGWQRVWNRDGPTPVLLEDFAVIARVKDPHSGQQVLTVGGLGRHGTAAAGEFLTVPEHLERLSATAPAGWEDGNVEIVIATTVTGDVAGPPRVVDAHYWK